MEKFKKNLFLQEYHREIDSQKVSDIDRLSINTFIRSTVGSIKEEDFFIYLRESLLKNKSYPSLDTGKDIRDALQSLGLLDQRSVIVIWNFPKDIDKFDLSYLIEYWEDIWFSPSDDSVALFFLNINKMILVTHYDTIYFNN